MIRYLLIFFCIPIGLFWLWFGLSYYDMNYGWFPLSRIFHDAYFFEMERRFGIPAQTIPGMIAKACIADLGIILSVFAFRRRREIREWWETRRGTVTADEAIEAGPVHPAE